MKITLPSPVSLKLPDGKTLEYSLPEMVRFIARNSKRFGAGRDVDSLRLGQRIEQAFTNPKGTQVELADEDWAELSKELRRPSCGWASISGTFNLQTGTDANGAPQVRAITKRLAVSGLDILPLIDGILTD